MSQPGQPNQFGQQPPHHGGYQPGGQYPPGGFQGPPASYGHYGQPGGYGGPPPRKNRTGLWVGLACGAVVLIAVVITGFVAPGFFLSKDSNSAAPPSNGAPQFDQSNPQIVAKQWADLVNQISPSNEAPAQFAFNLVCPSIMANIDTDPQAKVNAVKAVNGLTRTKEAVGAGDTFKVGESEPNSKNPQEIHFKVDSANTQKPVLGSLSVTKEGNIFCVLRFSAL